jgi:hypothetical protein
MTSHPLLFLFAFTACIIYGAEPLKQAALTQEKYTIELLLKDIEVLRSHPEGWQAHERATNAACTPEEQEKRCCIIN